MNILSIETSCDETGISIVRCSLDNDEYRFHVLANNLLSQIEIHAEYGGVFPALAKREHAKAIVPLIEKTLTEAGFEETADHSAQLKNAQAHLEREPEVGKQVEDLAQFNTDAIDAIAVTAGPGLAPALWVGVNTARALATLWQKPLMPVNHMHGHLFSALFPSSQMYDLPALGLLVSGGHTEILSLNESLTIELLGGTRDDAIGEAFDKAARLLELGYPGGPKISELAREHRSEFPDYKSELLPRPMMRDSSLDVSYSGLKTALLYHLRDNPIQNKKERAKLAREFEDAALDVVVAKVRRALSEDQYGSLIVGGGVIANTELRRRLEGLAQEFNLPLHLPQPELTTDNALMIAVAAFIAAGHSRGIEESSAANIAARANLASSEFLK